MSIVAIHSCCLLPLGKPYSALYSAFQPTLHGQIGEPNPKPFAITERVIIKWAMVERYVWNPVCSLISGLSLTSEEADATTPKGRPVM
jgi:hypothetical protein